MHPNVYFLWYLHCSFSGIDFKLNQIYINFLIIIKISVFVPLSLKYFDFQFECPPSNVIVVSSSSWSSSSAQSSPVIRARSFVRSRCEWGLLAGRPNKKTIHPNRNFNNVAIQQFFRWFCVRYYIFICLAACLPALQPWIINFYFDYLFFFCFPSKQQEQKSKKKYIFISIFCFINIYISILSLMCWKTCLIWNLYSCLHLWPNVWFKSNLNINWNDISRH